MATFVETTHLETGAVGLLAVDAGAQECGAIWLYCALTRSKCAETRSETQPSITPLFGEFPL